MTPFSLINAVAAILLIPAVYAAPSWNQITVEEAYVPRPEAAFTQCGNGKLCLLGGRGLDPVSILDTKTLSWSSGKVPPMEIHHFQAFQGPDKCAWVVGAWTGPFPEEKTVDEILIYCPDTDEWSSGPLINRPRGAGGAFLRDGSVYLVSGNVGGHNAGANLVNWFDKLDLETGAWSTLPAIPNRTFHLNSSFDAHPASPIEIPRKSTLTDPIYNFFSSSSSSFLLSFPEFLLLGNITPQQLEIISMPSFSIISYTSLRDVILLGKNLSFSTMLRRRLISSTSILKNGPPERTFRGLEEEPLQQHSAAPFSSSEVRGRIALGLR